MISPNMACGTVRYTHDATLFMHETCESQSGDPQQGAGERCTHQNGIHTIHHTAVPLEQMAHVFDTDIALEHGSTQITARAPGPEENPHPERNPPPSGQFRANIRACVFAELGSGNQIACIGYCC